ncbi:MAG: hypothetical protein KIS94_10535 [Chitinophagales bacterium]|nr:hypothetical protein [Chitinophagales bacterium]
MKRTIQISIILFALTFTATCYVNTQHWNLAGNGLLTTDFLGSTNNQPINIRTNNTLRAQFTTGGAFGSGTTQGDGLRFFDQAVASAILIYVPAAASKHTYVGMAEGLSKAETTALKCVALLTACGLMLPTNHVFLTLNTRQRLCRYHSSTLSNKLLETFALGALPE